MTNLLDYVVQAKDSEWITIDANQIVLRANGDWVAIEGPLNIIMTEYATTGVEPWPETYKLYEARVTIPSGMIYLFECYEGIVEPLTLVPDMDIYRDLYITLDEWVEQGEVDSSQSHLPNFSFVSTVFLNKKMALAVMGVSALAFMLVSLSKD